MGASLMNSTISLDDIYPVGSIYMNINSTNPTDLFGGVWEQIKERFMLGCGNTHTVGTTGGEFTHTLSYSEMPSHQHDILYSEDSNGNIVGNKWLSQASTGADGKNYWSRLTVAAGGSQPHNITPPTLLSISGKEQRNYSKGAVS